MGTVERQTGERVDRTEWHRVVTFQNGLVDMFEKHAKKGRLVYVAGKLQTRKWRKDSEDSDRFSTEILLVPGGRVQFLDKPANGNGAPASNGETAPPASTGPANPADVGRRYPVLSRLPPSRATRGLFRVSPCAEQALFLKPVPSRLRPDGAACASRAARRPGTGESRRAAGTRSLPRQP